MGCPAEGVENVLHTLVVADVLGQVSLPLESFCTVPCQADDGTVVSRLKILVTQEISRTLGFRSHSQRVLILYCSFLKAPSTAGPYSRGSLDLRTTETTEWTPLSGQKQNPHHF